MSGGLVEGQVMSAETSGRRWAGIGVALASAFALVAIVSTTVWALVDVPVSTGGGRGEERNG